MCVAAIGPALAIASSVAGYAGANAQASAQNELYKQNAAEARRAQADAYAGQYYQSYQQKVAADDKLLNQKVDAMGARATAQVAAGEAGVAGLSVDQLIGSFYAQEGRQNLSVANQFEANKAAIEAAMATTRAEAQGRINSVQRATPPSPLAFAIQGVGNAWSAWQTSTRSYQKDLTL